MISLRGTPLNVSRPSVGRVALRDVWRWKRENTVLICRKRTDFVPGYESYLFGEDFTSAVHAQNSPQVISGVRDIELIGDGDVVTLSPNGTINVLFQKGSIHNVIFLTGACNCKCIMCPQSGDDDEEDEDQLEVNLRLIELMDKSVKSLAITGGEPTVRRHDLIKVLQACKSSLPSTSLMILTNGILLRDRAYVEEILAVEHPSLVFAVPLYADTDTQHDEIIGRKGFNDTIKALHNLALYDQRIEIRTVMHSLNFRRLPNLAEFIYHNLPFVVHVAFMGMETRALALKNIERLWVDPVDYSSQLEDAIVYLHRTDLDVSIYNHQLCTLPRRLWPFAARAISSWKNIYIEQCTDCDFRDACGGFFESSAGIHSRSIRTLKKGEEIP